MLNFVCRGRVIVKGGCGCGDMGCESCVRELKMFKINRIRYDIEKK